MNPADMFTQVGSVIASVMFAWAMFKQYCPYSVQEYFDKYSKRAFTFVYPYIQISFNEFTGGRFMRSEAYSAIENYLGSRSSTQAKRLKADVVKNNQSVVLSMDDYEEVDDEFQGVKLRWASGKHISKSQSVSFYPETDEKKYYKLTFHKRHRQLILGDYLNHVLKEGNEIKVRNRQRKLYTNSGSYWRHVVFQHPASFETLAMEAERKQEIVDDLVIFSTAEDFYARIGRAWKRGYLLFGPPGTGKSTMIAAMANLLNYDIYDLELTAVKDNTELRKLLMETTSRSIIVIEDIDCSLDLTACRGERLIVFTTNFVEKLDPALIRKGRMDKHIELSYCSFEAFQVLAKNYLRLESHRLFARIQELLGETKMTPAEVAEHLMPKTITGDAKVCLESLIGALEKAKEDAILKAEEEAKEKEKESARLKAEEEAKAEEEEKEKAKAEEEAKEKDSSAAEKDSSAAENAKKQAKDNGFCDNGNGELNNKENKQEGFSH
ncbi:hypothetical protein H0E87_031027 [Populus deltoides]|uniref:AAA+ ATPase domain-containing protein n=1 Tax=Populus deltoides TaxID=3696 RepID=A0A8T2WLV7_POPDE|nr:hypothetical protein H0E87_031027 [Populus deltoides]